MLQLLKSPRKRKGQSTLEYVILIIIILAVLIVMQVYIKRAIQDKLRTSADSIGDQYADIKANISEVTVTNSHTLEQALGTQGTFSRLLDAEVTNTTKRVGITNSEVEFWAKDPTKP